MMLKMLMKPLAPYLNKITDGLDSMAKEYGVNECFLMVRKKMVNDRPVAVLTFMYNNNGSLSIINDPKTGKPVEYPIEKLGELISGESLSDEDEF